MELDLGVFAARDLVHPDLFGHPSPYAVVKLKSGKQIWATSTEQDTDQPQWNKAFHIRLWDVNDELSVSVHDDRTFTHGKLMGIVTFKVSELLKLDRPIEGWYPLTEVHRGEVLLSFTVASRIPRGPKVAIIGAGFAGAASAYYLNDRITQLGGEVKLTVFERDADVGGRVGDLNIGGQIVEKGGTGLLDTGRDNVAALMTKFGLKRGQPFDVKAPMGLWDGTEFIFNMGATAEPSDAVKFIWDLFVRYGFDVLKILELNKSNKAKFLHIYDLQDQHKAYDTIGPLLSEIGLLDLTQMTFLQFLQQKVNNPRLESELAAAFVRANNGLNPDQLTAFVGILSITLDPSTLYSVEGGNIKLIRKLLDESHAVVKKNSAVTKIKKVPGATANAHAKFEITVGTDVPEIFDAVVLATPIENASGLTLEGFTNLHPALTPAGFRPFLDVQEWWVIGDYDPAFFNQKDPMNVPQAILTTLNPAIPFQNINRIRVLPDGRNLYKVFSTMPFPQEKLKTLFKKIDAVEGHRWQMAYPMCQPATPDKWAPFKVDSRFYYGSAIEGIFSNIEFQILSAKNNVELLLHDLCDENFVSKPSIPPTLAASSQVKGDSEFDVVVVGSGLSGLTSAYQMLKHANDVNHKKLKVLVLEATDTIGGRTRSTQMKTENTHVSYGGTWCMFEDGSTLGLAQEVGFLPYPPKLKPNLSENGLNIWNLVLHPYLLIRLWLLGYKIAQAPQSYQSLDAKPLTTWLDEQARSVLLLDPKGAKQAVVDWFFQLENFPQEIENLSTFFAAIFVYRRIKNITPTGIILPKIFRWEGGTGDFVLRLQREIEKLGGRIVTKTPVTSIEDPSDVEKPVTITTGDGTRFFARAVVVASSVTSCFSKTAPIKITPSLPNEAFLLGDSIRGWNDPALNVILIFKSRWWSPKYGGSVFPRPPGQNFRGVYGPVMDLSDHDPQSGKKETVGVLRIIVMPERCMDAGVIWSDDRIIDSAVEYLRHYFGNISAADFKAQIVETRVINWLGQRPAIPAVTFYYPPNPAQTYAKYHELLRKNHGRIYFAGSERAQGGLHWMEGAVQRGNEIALQTLQQLRRVKKESEFWDWVHNAEAEALKELKRREVIAIGHDIEDFFDHLMKPIAEAAEGILHLFENVALTHTDVETRLSTRLTNPKAPRILTSSDGGGLNSSNPSPAASPGAAPANAVFSPRALAMEHVPSLSPRNSSANVAAAGGGAIDQPALVFEPPKCNVLLKQPARPLHRKPLFRCHNVTPHEAELLEQCRSVCHSDTAL